MGRGPRQQPVGVEAVHPLDAAPLVVEPFLATEPAEPGRHRGDGTATPVLARQPFAVRLRLEWRIRVELERPPANLDLGTEIEVRPGAFEAALSQPAPWAHD